MTKKKKIQVMFSVTENEVGGLMSSWPELNIIFLKSITILFEISRYLIAFKSIFDLVKFFLCLLAISNFSSLNICSCLLPEFLSGVVLVCFSTFCKSLKCINQNFHKWKNQDEAVISGLLQL